MTTRTADATDLVHAALKAAIEIETTGYLWGQPSTFVPAVCSKVFGDGRALLALTTCNSRPAFYVVRIDSTWGAEDHAMPAGAPDLRDFLDDIYDALEDDFGIARLEDDEEPDDWPAFDFGAGTSWSRMSWPAGIPAELDPHPFARCNVLSDFRVPVETA